MKKSIIKKINQSYYLIIINDNNDIESQIELTEKDPNNENSLSLPENPSNRKYVSMKKVDNSPNQEYELGYKESVHIDRKSTERKSDIEYLTDEEKSIYQSLMDKIKERKQMEKEKNKVVSDREKLIKKIEMLKKQLGELE